MARVGLVPNAVLAAQFTALEQLAPGRVIAGLGTGDRLSEEENRAYGIPFAPAVQRRAELVELARELVGAGIDRLGRRRAGRPRPKRRARPVPRSTCGTRTPRLVAERGAGGDGSRSPGRARRRQPAPPLGERVAALGAAPAQPGPCSAGRST